MWEHLPVEIQRDDRREGLRFYVVDAQKIATAAGLGSRVNTILQTCFFALADVLDQDGGRRADQGRRSRRATASAGAPSWSRTSPRSTPRSTACRRSPCPATLAGDLHRLPPVPEEAPDFVRRVTAMMIAGKGDLLPVSALPVDGTFPTDTAKWEKRSIAQEIPIWDPDDLHRLRQVRAGLSARGDPDEGVRADRRRPRARTFQHKEWRDREDPGRWMTIQVVPDDCTGCGVCVDVCPAKSKEVVKHKAIDMAPKVEHLDAERANFDFFLDIPPVDRREVKVASIKGSQMLEPLFESSGACAGCGETPYLKLLSQMYGDRILVANATGCSSIYGGNLPTTPWSRDANGRGPAWSNSLFEDNAEFGLGMRLALDHQVGGSPASMLERSRRIDRRRARPRDPRRAQEEEAQSRRPARARRRAEATTRGATGTTRHGTCSPIADALVRKSVWIVGGDGWAYDIGFGGLDHVLASGRDVNVLVLDTQVYSNTGGQASKATPRGAVAKFAAAGKPIGRKDLGLFAAGYGNVYVAQIALGADNAQTVKAFAEAESLARSVADHRVLDLHRPRDRHVDLDVASGRGRQERLLAALAVRPAHGRRGAAPDAARQQGHRRSRSKEFQSKEARFAMLGAAPRRSGTRSSSGSRGPTPRSAGGCTSRLAGVERHAPGHRRRIMETNERSPTRKGWRHERRSSDDVPRTRAGQPARAVARRRCRRGSTT